MPETIRLVARAVIVHNEKILVCRAIEQGHYFLPGGGVEFGERAEDTLRREMMEEAGVKLADAAFIGAAENVFTMNGVRAHEMITVFAVTLQDYSVTSKEAHIAFLWLPVDRVRHEKILPTMVTAAVSDWLRQHTTFWVSNIE